MQSQRDARRQPRSSLFLTAVMQSEGEQVAVKIRNLSPNGAMIDASMVLPVGASIKLVRGKLIATGNTVWVVGGRIGLQFASGLNVSDWLAAPDKAEQRRIDDVVSLIRAGALPESKSHDVHSYPSSRVSGEQIAEDLGTVVDLIQQLEDELSDSHDTVARHGDKLQNLDIAVQMLRSIARQFASSVDDRSSDAASLSSLRAVCSKALGESRG